MENYNNFYRRRIFERIENYKQSGINEANALELCCNQIYNDLAANRIVNMVAKDPKATVMRNLFNSVLYIDLSIYLNYLVSDTDEMIPVVVSNNAILRECESFEDVEKLFKEDFQMFCYGVSAIYELYNFSAFAKIECFSALSENTKNRMLSVAPNFIYDIEQYKNINIDKEYIIKKVNGMASSDIEPNMAIEEIVCFLSWMKNNKPDAYKKVLSDMTCDFRTYNGLIQEGELENHKDEVEEIDEEVIEVAKKIGKMSELSDEELIGKYDAFDMDYLKQGIAAFIYFETKYGEKLVDSDDKQYGK